MNDEKSLTDFLSSYLFCKQKTLFLFQVSGVLFVFIILRVLCLLFGIQFCFPTLFQYSCWKFHSSYYFLFYLHQTMSGTLSVSVCSRMQWLLLGDRDTIKILKAGNLSSQMPVNNINHTHLINFKHHWTWFQLIKRFTKL